MYADVEWLEHVGEEEPQCLVTTLRGILSMLPGISFCIDSRSCSPLLDLPTMTYNADAQSKAI